MSALRGKADMVWFAWSSAYCEGGTMAALSFGHSRDNHAATSRPAAGVSRRSRHKTRPCNIRASGPARTADQVGQVDAVLLSHDQHADNFDRSGKAYAMAAPHLFTTLAGGATAWNPGRRVGPLAKHGSQQAGPGDIANNRNSGATRSVGN
jgi:hypothetical protein